MTKTQSKIMSLALAAGLEPRWRAIWRAAGMSAGNSRTFTRAGYWPATPTIAKLAGALGVTRDEMRKLHAAVQAELATETTEMPVAVVVKLQEPRDLAGEVREAAFSGDTMAVSSESQSGELSICVGRVAGFHDGWIHLARPGNTRPVSISEKSLVDVRKVPAIESPRRPA